ncbi:putative IclR-family regulatory protein [uncultured delta proteobacterium]|uniref:Putative IclR-family regulatory protein n=1 Tax=uncultured delta proteobacterium TaxID=34034 RepID=A0A212KEI0_9DELT|nr:putative IclR-family regulatory protein [uncultured delta proteobacterium]
MLRHCGNQENSVKNSYEETSDGAHQNIARATHILDVLAASGKNGLRLTDVVLATGLKKTVVHRALAGLTAHGLAIHDGATSRFHLGDKLFAWVHKARDRFALADRVRPFLESLAADILDTVYFSVIRGDDAICYCRVEGSFPIRTLTLEVGSVRPLGVGSGSLALLAFQPVAVRERIIAERAAERVRYDIDDAALRRNITVTREKGYALHKGLFAEGMMGLGVPVYNTAGISVGALSTAAITARLEGPRLDEVAARMQTEADAIRAGLAELLDEI